MKILKYVALAVLSVLVVIVLVVGSWLAYWAFRPKIDISPAAYPYPKGIPDSEVDRLASELLAQMSLEEKLEQMSGEGFSPLIASSLLFDHMAVTYSGANERLQIPPVAFTDGPRGVVVARATSFPVAMARGATWDPDLERRVADVIGKEARAAGANYFGGVCINLLRHPSWGRAEETFSEDPWHMAQMALALVEGVQQHNVMACAKHYALNSIENSRFGVNVEIDERALREVYLPAYRRLVETGVASIMSAYNRVRGEYCGHNRYLLTTVLRDEWGFRGFVTSDWMLGLRDALKGVQAGMDIEMPSPVHYGDPLRQLISDGQVTEEEIDTIVFRILRTKLRYVTRDDPMEYEEGLIAAPEHVRLAREVAEESMVLLQNRGGILPFHKNEISKLGVVGHLIEADNTGDRGSSKVKPPYLVTPLQGFRDYLGSGIEILSSDGRDLSEVRRIAEEADAVVVIAGFTHDEAGEYVSVKGVIPKDETELEAPFGFSGRDRYPLGLKDRDLQVIETVAPFNDRVVVALITGSAVTMESWRGQVPSILVAWYFGMEGGHALARVLFGDVNPSGRLPFTVPLQEADLPPFDPFAEEVEYGYYHGYTHFDKNGIRPAFPFGFGLSYTQFRYDYLEIATPQLSTEGELRATVQLTNTGLRHGAEVAQFYVGFENSQVDRPVKVLRGFRKVHLNPGESATTELILPVSELAWYNPDRGQWEIETMEYSLYAGPSADSAVLLRGSFEVVAP